MTKTFITAGAGSGKTYRITTDVAKMVNDKNIGVKPDQVIMTTFTKAAAQELREKAKKELVNLGLHDEAQQMEHALIGTVHSVANSFLTKYWYLLGITPDAAAMEESELQLYRDHSLRGLLEPKDRTFLYHYAETYNVSYDHSEHKPGVNYEFWKKDLCQVLDYIQWYSISDEQLKKSVATTESFIACLDEAKDDTSLMKQAKAVINDIEDALNSLRRQTDKSNNERQRIKSVAASNATLCTDVIGIVTFETSCCLSSQIPSATQHSFNGLANFFLIGGVHPFQLQILYSVHIVLFL